MLFRSPRPPHAPRRPPTGGAKDSGSASRRRGPGQAGARAHRNRRSQPAAQAKRPPFLQAAVPKPPQQQLRHPPPPLDTAYPRASHNPNVDAPTAVTIPQGQTRDPRAQDSKRSDEGDSVEVHVNTRGPRKSKKKQ